MKAQDIRSEGQKSCLAKMIVSKIWGLPVSTRIHQIKEEGCGTWDTRSPPGTGRYQVGDGVGCEAHCEPRRS